MNPFTKIKNFLERPAPDPNNPAKNIRDLSEYESNIPRYKPTWFDKILDWGGAPSPRDLIEVGNAEEATKLNKGYWEAIQQKYYQPRDEIHQHVHIYQEENGEYKQVKEESRVKEQ